MNEGRRNPLFPSSRFLSVSELNALARRTLESSLGRIDVTGEASNVSYHSSGHVYWTIKDAGAQVAVVIWRATAQRMRCRIQEGHAYNVSGLLTIYEAGGRYQLIASQVDPAGQGLLERKFLELKAHYETAGYFLSDRKRPIPFLPHCIVVITSPTGAAIHDITKSIWGRFPRARILVLAVRVQGATAAPEIAEAIQRANDDELGDVLIVGRGGGSLEDLWAFNEPAVIEAVFNSRIPVVSAVGHEVDVTLCDLVADVRAFTPTDAGQKVVPLESDVRRHLERAETTMTRELRRRLREIRQLLLHLERSRGLSDPARGIADRRQQLDGLERRLTFAIRQKLNVAKEMSRTTETRLLARSPKLILRENYLRLKAIQAIFESAVARRITQARSRIESCGGLLFSLSPDRVLERGFSITYLADRRTIVRSNQNLTPGTVVTTRLADGEFSAHVIGQG